MSSTSSTGHLYVRHDIWSLETPNVWDPITLAYANAVGEMQSRDPSDPTSWNYQSAMHGTYANPPAGADWNQCQHASWFFLPWHRMYIYWFEEIVRSIVVSHGGSADWALPYWNYSKGSPSNALPPAFRRPTLPNGSRNPLYLAEPHRARGVNAGARLPANLVSFTKAYSYTDYVPDFGGGESPAMQFENATGALENQPHNVVHDLLGGQTDGECQIGWMSDPMCAAADPIFWLHHSNIDRLWVNWLFLGGGRSNPTDQAWLTQQYAFYNANGSQVTMQVSDILDMETQLQYRYDDTPPPVARAGSPRIIGMAPPAPQPPTPPTTVATSQQPIQLTGQTTTVDVPLPAAAQAVTARAATPTSGFSAAPTGAAPRIYLNVEDIEVTQHPGVVYEVYLNQPPNQPPDPNSEHYVGTVTFFGASHHQGHGGMSHRYDITNLVPELSARGKWDPNQMAVTFVPRGLEPDAGATPTLGAAPTAAPVPPTPPVRIGRVSLSHR